MRLAERNNFHRPSMMRSPGIGCLHPSPIEILYPSQDDGSMVNGVDLNSQVCRRYLIKIRIRYRSEAPSCAYRSGEALECDSQSKMGH